MDARVQDLVLNGDERWFLVHTLAKSETRAQMHLRLQGFRTFVPLIAKTIRHARQLRSVKAPFFPRYIFIKLDLGRDRWLSVRSTVGVSNLFTCDGRPTAVPRGIVEALIERMADGGLLLPELDQGQKVRIVSGPFAGFSGKLDRLDERGRVRVLLETMSAAVAIEMERFRVLPAA